MESAANMVRVLSREEVAVFRLEAFELAEPGFLAEKSEVTPRNIKRLKVIVAKDDKTKTLTAISLSRENLLHMVTSGIFEEEIIGLNDLLNVYVTE